MKKLKYLLFLSAILSMIITISCSSDEEVEPEGDEESGDTTALEQPGTPIRTDMRTFIFGHSLINHEPPLFPVPSNETSVPHWMADLVNATDYTYAVSGQYGFLPQHANLPPFAQWGFDLATPAWDSDNETFEEADFNTILLTAGNFIQYQPATENYFGEDFSPVDATVTIADWVTEQEPGITIYIYENWPDMAGFLANDFPPSDSELASYYEYTEGEFHDWWIDYQDQMIEVRPDVNVRMIPVGPILSKLLTSAPLNEIPVQELYEDDAPHGRPTIYFLAGLITYMAMYGIEAPADYNVPETVNVIVTENYTETVNSIWSELEDFNFENGDSRLW